MARFIGSVWRRSRGILRSWRILDPRQSSASSGQCSRHRSDGRAGRCRGPTGIAKWAALKEEFLVAALDLPNGVPRKDVFRRVLMSLKPAAFQACFANWLQSLRVAAAEATGMKQPIFAVDGKTARRSHDRSKGLGALHSVSVWASEFGLSLGQVACAEKSNEITAIPELLRLVDIKGAIITIDAMGTQKAIAEQIIDGKADYVLALKGNQGTLHQEVIDHINEQIESDFAHAHEHVTMGKGHGREEMRTYLQMPAPEACRGTRTVERAEVDRHGSVAVPSQWKGDSRGSLLHQQSCGEREEIRPRSPQSLGR